MKFVTLQVINKKFLAKTEKILEVTLFYPDNSRMLLGLSGTASTISSMIPLLWHYSIVNNQLSYVNLMIIWCVLTFLSFIISLIISPWHNLNHFPKGETVKTNIALVVNNAATAAKIAVERNTGKNTQPRDN